MMDDFNSEMERLVEALYSSKEPAKVLQIQKELQIIQKSPAGWEVADALLNVDSSNCKFFGALTYTVNINLHSSEISEVRAAQIITQLLAHTINLFTADKPNSSFLVKKLLSNLALMYINCHELWKDPLTSLAASVSKLTPVLNVTGEPFPSNSSRIAGLVLLFSQIIVEEILRRELPSWSKLNEHVHYNVFPITSNLLFHTLVFPESLDCLSSWVQYISVAEYNSTERYDISRPLSLLLDLIVSSDESISSKAFLVTVDTLEVKPAFFNKELRLKLENVIFSSWAVDYLQKAKEIDDYDNINSFSRLVTTYLETDVLNFAASILDTTNSTKCDFLLSLTDFPGTPVAEEMVSKDLLEFWSELTETFIDDQERLSIIHKNDIERLLLLNEKMLEVLNKVCFIYWKKIHIPRSEFASFKTPYLSYRMDVADFFDLVYAIVKVPFYEFLIQNVLSSLSGESPNISDIESSLYVLNAISVNFTENNINMDILENLSNLLESPFLQVLSSRISDSGSSYVINTLIQFLSGIDFFYKHKFGIRFLSSILNFMFDCIIQISVYRLSASKAVSKIADDCRLYLVDYLSNFQNILSEMIENPAVEGIVRERITNSYASIIQGTKNPEVQVPYLNNFLKIVQNKVESLCKEDAVQNPEVMGYLISLLNCVSELGKGMQVPDDIDVVFSEEESRIVEEYWSRDPLNIHGTIITILHDASLNRNQPVLVESREILDKCCLIIRRGFTESISGPFTLSDSVVLDFITAKVPICSQDAFPLLFQLMESLVISNYMNLSLESISGPMNVLLYQNVEQIKNDSDLMESSISMIATIIEKKPKLVLDNNFPKILDLCLKGLDKNEKFILKASSKFWSNMIVLKKGDRADHEYVSSMFINESLGMLLTHRTLVNFMQTLRSNMEYFQDILKFLVAKYPLQVRNWLVESFKQISNARMAQNLNLNFNYDLFVKKMMATRGKGHQFSNVVKEFWLEVNGLTNY